MFFDESLNPHRYLHSKVDNFICWIRYTVVQQNIVYFIDIHTIMSFYKLRFASFLSPMLYEVMGKLKEGNITLGWINWLRALENPRHLDWHMVTKWQEKLVGDIVAS